MKSDLSTGDMMVVSRDFGAELERLRIRRAIAMPLRTLRRYVDNQEARRAWATLPAACPHMRRTSCVKCWPPLKAEEAIKAIDAATRKPAKGKP